MWADLAISGGLSLLRNGLGYSDAKESAEAKRAWQNYKNTMLKLSGAMNAGIIETNENLAVERSSRQAFDITRSEYITSAQAEVVAAASGTGGRSVNAVMFDIERNAASAQTRRRNDLEDQFSQFDNQQLQNAFQVATQIDYSPIPEPNPATYALNFATDAYKLYKSSK